MASCWASAARACGSLLMLLRFSDGFAQADYAREKRWADEITPGLVVGDAVQLDAKSAQVHGHLYAGAAAGPAVIVVHGLGVHPDWTLVNALRSRLADHGYATLSMQMPVLAATAKAEEYPPVFPEAAERLARGGRVPSRQRSSQDSDRFAQHGLAHGQLLSGAQYRRRRVGRNRPAGTLCRAGETLDAGARPLWRTRISPMC